MKIFSLQSKGSLVVWSLAVGLVIAFLSEFYARPIPNPPGLECTSATLNCAPYEGFGFPFYHSLNLNDYIQTAVESGINGFLAIVYVFAMVLLQPTFWLNTFFWSVISVMILFAIRQFRKKSYQLSVKQN